ncbi:heat shock factor 2-binding protein isoform X1 [Neodiprion pinetum]|uniref:Heat shock factor 2-binding protein isoform X2 n=2 Tax=Neodiprion TaxID=270857 RepID=A0ABM3GD73_NEOLC|nr:heat shock factor 2-binding protein-like isoform X1 [Neodiprion pinetum]XP_046483393.1 heat shock factor 2-binding protein-like isoform X1 [Neodiprion pinetum]XP_046483394.1 heat shock factor 2-binding protein-like isoform X1 [Neodiprion pinetum]XP_046598229.1 heat shock factor 2-binding protein isoform X2 [Neodiprion lecontei]
MMLLQCLDLRLYSRKVMHQSTFCASLGAVLGNLVWHASRFPHVVELWLSKFQAKLGEFLCIVNGTFVSFINTYGSVFPSENSDEFQFVKGLCGIVTNLSASPGGRQFLVTHPNGKNLLQKMVKLMPVVPLPTGNSLARLILMLLYNVSINKSGLQYLIELRICQILGPYLSDSISAELKHLSLRLLQSITFELRDELTIDDILTKVTVTRIQELVKTETEIVSSIAKEVILNLKNCQSSLIYDGRFCQDRLDKRTWGRIKPYQRSGSFFIYGSRSIRKPIRQTKPH